jgi:hypothetical protein
MKNKKKKSSKRWKRKFSLHELRIIISKKRWYNCMFGSVDNESAPFRVKCCYLTFFYYYTLIYFAITWMYAAIFIDLTSPDYKTWLIVGSTTDKYFFVHMYIYFYLFQIFQDSNFLSICWFLRYLAFEVCQKALETCLCLPLLIFKRKWLQTCIVDR